MIGSQFPKKNIEADSPGSFFREFLQNTSVNMTRPVESVLVTDRSIADSSNAVVTDIGKSKIGSHFAGASSREAHPPVIAHPFQPLEKIERREKARETLNEANQNNNERRNKNGNVSK